MVIQSLIAKIALVTLTTGIVGSSIAVPVVLTSGIKEKSAEVSHSKSPNPNECFVIPTETIDNGSKFVICTDGEFYLHNSEQEKPFSKITNIEGPNTKQLTVALGTGGKSWALSGEEWNTYPKDMKFQDNCKFGYVDGIEPALICSQKVTFEGITKKLTKLI